MNLGRSQHNLLLITVLWNGFFAPHGLLIGQFRDEELSNGVVLCFSAWIMQAGFNTQCVHLFLEFDAEYDMVHFPTACFLWVFRNGISRGHFILHE